MLVIIKHGAPRIPRKPMCVDCVRGRMVPVKMDDTAASPSTPSMPEKLWKGKHVNARELLTYFRHDTICTEMVRRLGLYLPRVFPLQ